MWITSLYCITETFSQSVHTLHPNMDPSMDAYANALRPISGLFSVCQQGSSTNAGSLFGKYLESSSPIAGHAHVSWRRRREIEMPSTMIGALCSVKKLKAGRNIHYNTLNTQARRNCTLDIDIDMKKQHLRSLFI